ncbi:MAG TPA: hypothetical protein VHF45_06520 [Thermoleophilaceae bacterium]|nr:hypothetical protein [Thermoleophilaceae bacterium]
MLGLDPLDVAGLGRQQRRPPQQLADERGRGAVGLVHDPGALGRAEPEALRVQVEQPPPRLGVGQRQAHRQVDAAGPRRERRLQDLGPVRSEHEDDVGVLVQPVHLVQQLEEDRVRLLELVAVERDEVHVLQHDHRRRERAGYRAGGADRLDAAPREQERRALRHQRGEVHHGQRLAGAGRAVQQQPAAQVAPHPPQLLGVRGEQLRVALDPFQDAAAQHDALALHARKPPDHHSGSAPRRLGQLEHPAAVDVVLVHQAAQLREKRLRALALGRHHLQPQGGLAGPVILAGEHQRERAVRAREQPEPGTDAADPPLAHLHRLPLRRARFRQRTHANPRRLDQLREPGPVPLDDRQADQVAVVALALEPGVERDLEVDPVVAGERGGDDRKLRRVRAEVLAQPRTGHRLRVRLLPGALLRPL